MISENNTGPDNSIKNGKDWIVCFHEGVNAWIHFCITGHFWEESTEPVMQNFDVFFVVSLNKQTCYWWCGVTLIWWVIMSANTKYCYSVTVTVLQSIVTVLQCYRYWMLALLDPVLFHSKPIRGGFGSGDWQNWYNLVNCLGIQLHTCLKLKDNSL